ncbi:hypothetical protein [Chryseobacterium bernardetii]|uniref:hypothetical protein n=1 Tax=Chryseobacterium bernardetii TaxID=1241978 RepID=UPI0030172744
MGEISYFANFITEIWAEKVWNLLIEHTGNQLIITLQDETIKELLIQENPSIFKSNEDIYEFCKKYNLRIEHFVDAGKFENLEIELEGISARLSSEIIFFRKKIFTELLIQKLNSKIYKYEDVSHYSKNEDLRDGVDNLRLALELLLKDIFCNDKSLENQLPQIGKYQKDLGISKEIRNTFQKTIEYYNTYQNEHVKHDDNISNRHEAEFIFGLTMLFIRMLIKPNLKFSSL